MQPYSEVTYSVEVGDYRASVRFLVAALLKEYGGKLQPVPESAPVAVHVEYYARSQGFIDTKGKALHHLSAPSAAGVSEVVCRALVKVGVCRTGQIVRTECTKFSSFENRLTVTVQVVSAATRPDKPDRKLKVLRWYLRNCKESARLATRHGFWALMKQLGAEGDDMSPAEKAAVEAKLEAKAKANKH